MWTDRDLETRAKSSWPQYMAQDGWGFGKSPDQDQQIGASLRMYNSVSGCGLPFLLLGDAKIRSDGTLVQNFGFASGSGSEDQKLVADLDAKRKEIAKGAKIPSAPIPVSGSGSILSDQKWTPLVNDSFILGGVHRGMEFVLALQDFDQSGGAFKGDGKDQWKAYLKAKPDVLWNSSQACPRVFARELIGLRTFGYTPSFNRGQLGFGRGSGKGTADFSEYLRALLDAGFPSKVKARVLSAVSEFLFGDGKALD